MSVSFLTIFSVLPIILLLLILGVVFVAVRSKGTDPGQVDKGGKKMIKTVYTYLVLFATLMMTIGGSVAAFMAVADIISPNAYYMSYEDYKTRYTYTEKEEKEKEQVIKSEEEIRKEYDAMVAEETERSRSRAYNSLIKSFGWIVIPLPVFIYYQRRLGREY